MGPLIYRRSKILEVFVEYKIGIIGLGLMGGSLAFALRGFRGAWIVGADVQAEVCQKAERSGAVDEAHTDAAKAMESADLIIFCVYAHNIPALIEKNRSAIRPGAVLTDICGVKSGLYKELEGVVPEHADYIGIHPMAGKEKDGFDNADPVIYKNSGLIICPLPSTRKASIELMRELAGYIGVTRLAVSPAGIHDEIIAYTSDLMHISAAGLCLDYHRSMSSAYTAGAYRDCTRIADINAEAWTELLMANRLNTMEYLDRHIGGLEKIRECLAERDDKGLYELLEIAGQNKREMLKR